MRQDSIFIYYLSKFLSVMFAVPTAVFLGTFLERWGYVGHEFWIVVFGFFVFAFLHYYLPKFFAQLLFPLSPRLAAYRLGRALKFVPMLRTHVLSFIYPGDEAGRVLEVLEKTTALPTKAVKWFKGIASVVASFAGLIFFASAIFSEPIMRATGWSEERLKQLAFNSLMSVLIAAFTIWFALVAARYVLGLLRGHPAGFGWERPSIHAHIDVGIRAVDPTLKSKSNVHKVVPFTAREDAKRGLRHSGLYEDRRILKALAYWMAHVK